MVVQQKYQVIDAESGMLDSRVFTDEQFYQDELEKVFGRAWLFIGHESLIPNPNDFFLTYMGEDPVILTRDAKGEVHAFLNMCRHRGNRIVRADDGNAKNFMCSYHGWTYSNEGKLVSVPGLQEAYYGELDVDSLGLVSVAHLDIYAGIVFATWASDAPTLEEYLGDMRWYLDVRYNHRDNGIQVVGPVKWVVPANWKVGVENAIGDNYHGFTTHMSSYIVQQRYRGRDQQSSMRGDLRFRQPGRQVSPGNGHGLLATVLDADPELANMARQGQGDGDAATRYAQSILPEMERRLGVHRARRVQPRNFAVFPNMWLGLRMAHPRGPLATEVWSFEVFDKDAPDEIKENVLRRAPQNGAGHPAGTHAQDDMDNWRNVTEQGKSATGRKQWQNLSMGLSLEARNNAFNGRTSDRFCSEINQRSYYTRWQEMMNAESWADISIDPITATFEGSATFKG
jgi:phenylpropionate dioxygenase-like ring-hydroxylating dioxygenase large terminal subunit